MCSRRIAAALILTFMGGSAFTGCRGNQTSQAARGNASTADDLIILRDTLEDAHPNLFFHESKAAFEGAIDRARTHLGQDPTPTAEFKVIAPIVSAIGDAHTQVSVETSDFTAFRDSGGLLFPLDFRYQQRGRAFVTLDYDEGHGMPAGSEIVAIGGTPIADLMASFERYESGETAEVRGYAASMDIRELLWESGVRAPFDVTLRDGTGTARGQLPGAAWPAIDAWHAANPDAAEVAEVKFRVDRARSIATLTLRDFETQDDARWQAALATILQQLRDGHVRSLIVDLRENPGGATHFADELLAMFARKPYRNFSHVREKVSAVTKAGLDPDSYLHRYGPDALKAPDGATIAADIPPTQPLPASDVYEGNVYVLVGVGTLSTAAIFAAAVQDSRNGAVWGQTTGGYATLYGEISHLRCRNQSLS